MSKLKRNYIKLIKEVKDNEECLYDTFITPHFIPFRKVYEAADLLDGNLKEEQNEIEVMGNFICELYENQFTLDQLIDGLHAPEAVEELRSQIEFIASGAMDAEREVELKKMLA